MLKHTLRQITKLWSLSKEARDTFRKRKVDFKSSTLKSFKERVKETVPRETKDQKARTDMEIRDHVRRIEGGSSRDDRVPIRLFKGTSRSRLAPAEFKELKTQLEELIKLGFIRPSH